MTIICCEWRWHRFEWQSRTKIHAHGAARFNNDPGLIELSKQVYLAKIIAKKCAGKIFSNEEFWNTKMYCLTEKKLKEEL